MVTKNRITINLDESRYQRLTQLSNELDVSLAWLGRKALTDLLDKYCRDDIDGGCNSTASDPVDKLVSNS